MVWLINFPPFFIPLLVFNLKFVAGFFVVLLHTFLNDPCFVYHCLFQSQLLCALWSVCCVKELLKLPVVSSACTLCMMLTRREKLWFPPLPLAETCWETLPVMAPLRLQNCPPQCIQAPPWPRMELCSLGVYIGVNAEHRCLPGCCQIWSGYWFSITANTAARILCSGLFNVFVPGGNSPLPSLLPRMGNQTVCWLGWLFPCLPLVFCWLFPYSFWQCL